MLMEVLAKSAAAKPAAAAPAPTASTKAATACYAKPDQHTSQCHGAMASLGLKVGKNGQLVISDKTKFTTSNEPDSI